MNIVTARTPRRALSLSPFSRAMLSRPESNAYPVISAPDPTSQRHPCRAPRCERAPTSRPSLAASIPKAGQRLSAGQVWTGPRDQGTMAGASLLIRLRALPLIGSGGRVGCTPGSHSCSNYPLQTLPHHGRQKKERTHHLKAKRQGEKMQDSTRRAKKY